MKEEAWVKKQLKEIEKLQQAIIVQQSRADETLKTLKRESVRVLDKINELSNALGGFVSPELEEAIKEVLARAHHIDKKVSDTSCPE